MLRRTPHPPTTPTHTHSPLRYDSYSEKTFSSTRCNRGRSSNAFARTYVRTPMADDGGIIAALPEDVLLQVLSRVASVKSLFMLAATCRRWLRRFTDRAFLLDLWGGQRAGDLLGFFFHLQRIKVSTFGFLPVPSSPLRPLASSGSSNSVQPLAARRGVLLMRLPITRLLFLSNPVTGERHVVPRLEEYSDLGPYKVTSYAIVVSDDLAGKPQQPASSGRFTFSQLLVTTKHANSITMYVNSYSAAGGWAAPAEFLDLLRFSLAGRSTPSAVVHRGAAHWLCTDDVASATRGDRLYKLSVEVGVPAAATPRVSMTNLPVRAGGATATLLCVGGDGELTIACVFPMHVRIWKQQRRGDGDDDAAAWRRDVMWMTLPAPYPYCVPLMHGLDMGSVAMMYRSSGAVFVVDLDKKVIDRAMDCFLPLRIGREMDLPPVPYEMDLVEFFLLQLGGLCGGGSTSTG
ncbi:Os01g0152100 [Oryza sativa Japonica Group]|uniref:Os01g0152100 protein n=4 Tax=Oryza TaxID=4527 RepID=A0A0P0UY63_ORYSJ|nr:Os01g0152100 [Oryza sativa Japonica Group]